MRAEGAIGTVLFAYSWIMPRTGQGEALVPAALIARGGTDTMVEMVTVVPYLGVIALMTRAGLPAAQWLPICSSTRALRHATGSSHAGLYDHRSVPEAVFRAARPGDHAQRARGVELNTRAEHSERSASSCCWTPQCPSSSSAWSTCRTSRIIPASAEPCALPYLRPVWRRYARPRDMAFGIVRPILRISTVMRIYSVGILPCVSLSPPSAASTPAEGCGWW